MKNKHRIKQGLALLLAGGIALTNLGVALPAFAEDAVATPETAEAATPETAEADATAPNLVQITENLYNDLPDAPTGSYLGSMGLPVATGETKIGISAWVSDLYDGVDAHMDADALNADENTVTIGKTPGTDYAIVPLLAQVEYPADGAVSEIILPDGVELLSYLSTDYEPIPADDREQAEILHQTYSEQSAAATGLYVKASADFTAQLVYLRSYSAQLPDEREWFFPSACGHYSIKTIYGAVHCQKHGRRPSCRPLSGHAGVCHRGKRPCHGGCEHFRHRHLRG